MRPCSLDEVHLCRKFPAEIKCGRADRSKRRISIGNNRHGTHVLIGVVALYLSGRDGPEGPERDGGPLAGKIGERLTGSKGERWACGKPRRTQASSRKKLNFGEKADDADDRDRWRRAWRSDQI